jgi:DNA-binding YbaB/EbfC family protein
MKTGSSPGKLVKTLASLQGNMTRIQKEIETSVFTGQAAGGLLKIEINGKGEARQVTVDPKLLADAPDMLGDVIAAAINDAQRRKDAFAKEKLKGMAGGLLPVGFAVPGLG